MLLAFFLRKSSAKKKKLLSFFVCGKKKSCSKTYLTLKLLMYHFFLYIWKLQNWKNSVVFRFWKFSFF